jgi:hypothetical protein
MRQVTLNVEDNKFETLLNFLKTLDYVKVSDSDMTIQQFQNSLKQVKQIQAGKIQKKSIEKLLNGVQD